MDSTGAYQMRADRIHYPAVRPNESIVADFAVGRSLFLFASSGPIWFALRHHRATHSPKDPINHAAQNSQVQNPHAGRKSDRTTQLGEGRYVSAGDATGPRCGP
jgi:hypothetical protein